MTPEETKILVAASVSGLSAGASLWAWVIRRWIQKVDSRFDSLSQTISDLKTHSAVRDERLAHLLGALDMLRESIASTTKDVGHLAATVAKMFAVLEAKGVIEQRFSDEVCRNKVG